MSTLTIAKFAEAGGVSVETVRFYQRKGLLAAPARPVGVGRAGGIRHYGPDDVRQLRFIRAAQAAGFTLQEIGELLKLDATDEREQAYEMARVRIAALDAQIAELTAARNALAKLAHRCAHSGAGPCPILSAFEPA